MNAAAKIARKKPQSKIAAAVASTLAPTVLLSFQQSWVADEADVAVWEKSRRIGASWCTASLAVLTAAKAGGMDVLYIGYSEDMTREFIDDCAMWAKSFNRAAGVMQEVMFDDTDESGETRHIKAFRIDFGSGNKILALSSRPRSIRGKQGLVIIDEAAFHDDLDGLLTAALALLIWGGKVRVLSSHNGEDNPFNLLVKDIRAGKVNYSLHRTTFDDALRMGLYDRVALVMGERMKEKSLDEWRTKIYDLYGDRARQELDCIPTAGEGVYLPRMLVEACGDASIPVVKYTKPPEFMLDEGRIEVAQKWIRDVLKPLVDAMPTHLRTVLGQDFGRSGDLSDIWILQQHSPTLWRTAFILELRRMPFDVQQLILFYLMDELPLLHHAKFDARGNGQSHAEAALQRYGVAKVECVMATQTWYAVNFPPYRTAFEDKTIVVPASEDIIADHRRVILKKGIPGMDEGRDKGSDGEYRHGDSAIAGVMAWAATREEGVPAAGTTIESNQNTYTPEAYANRRRHSIFRSS